MTEKADSDDMKIAYLPRRPPKPNNSTIGLIAARYSPSAPHEVASSRELSVATRTDR